MPPHPPHSTLFPYTTLFRSYDREYKDSQLLKRILGYFKPHLPVMGTIAVLIVLNSLMDAAFPFLIARSLDRLEGAADLNVTDRKSTRLNSSHVEISYAVFCL